MDLRALRAAKNDFFRHSHDSPLDHEQRHAFTGLRYYPEDQAFRFVLELDTTDAGSTEEIEMSNGSSDRMLRAGHFDFTLDGKPVRLEAEVRAGEKRFHANG